MVAVLVRAEPGSADDLFKHHRNDYPTDPRQHLALGPADGYTTTDDAVLAFDCLGPKNHTSKADALGVSVSVLASVPADEITVEHPELTKSAAKLAADTARYVSSTVLKCSSPHLPDGSPTQRPIDKK
jgi:hypothetical protein